MHVTLESGKNLFVEIHEPTAPVSPSAPAILLVHGLGSSSTFYDAALSYCSLPGHRIIAFDTIGHGLSDLSTGKVTVEGLAQDLAALLDTLGEAGPVQIVAHSMGGLVACHFASKCPERVAKMILLGPVKSLVPAGAAAMVARAALARNTGLAKIVPVVLAAATSVHTRTKVPLAQALIRALILGTNPEGYARACEALAGATNPDWKKITAKVLVVGGAEDYMCTKEVVQGFLDVIEGSRSIELPEVGHWIAVESPERVANIMVEFFE